MNEEKFEKIWSRGYFILDTCALDYISRCEFQYAKHIMDILLFCKERILIPQHVVKEMQPYFDMKKIQKNVDVIFLELEKDLNRIYTDNITENIKRNKVISRVSKKINLLQRYAFGVYASMLDNLKKDYAKQEEVVFPSFSKCLELANKEIDAISKSEIINSFLQMIMEKTLPEFSEQEKTLLFKDEQERISKQLPPGVGDSGKKNNSNGDIIIWNEIKKCIKDKGNVQYLFITNDEKKNSNWFGNELAGLHPLLQEEIYKIYKYDALDITTLYGFILFCKPYVDKDIDTLCEYLVNHNNFIRLELEGYFNNEGNETLMDGISEYIRSNYMGDWAIPYDLDIEIDSLECASDLLNGNIDVLFEFGISGNAEACYHCESEDNIFDTEYEAYGSATVNIPIQIGEYTKILSLKYNGMKLHIVDMDIKTTDPLNGDEEDEEGEYENYEDYEDYENYEWFDE